LSGFRQPIPGPRGAGSITFVISPWKTVSGQTLGAASSSAKIGRQLALAGEPLNPVSQFYRISERGDNGFNVATRLTGTSLDQPASRP
jgi:hypothetical protein